jgi:hypothetical protein
MCLQMNNISTEHVFVEAEGQRIPCLWSVLEHSDLAAMRNHEVTETRENIIRVPFTAPVMKKVIR